MLATSNAQTGLNHPNGQQSLVDSVVQLGNWEVTEKSVLLYTQAVGDTSNLYLEYCLAPPLALTAWTLGKMLKHLDLPSGAIHSLQEMQITRGVRFGEQVAASMKVSQPRRRGNLEFINAAYKLKDADGEDVLVGQSTVLVNQGPVSGSPRQGSDANQTTRSPAAAKPPHPWQESSLETVERTITKERLIAYSQASGDYNPLHLDPEFAATTQFEGIIAHGMLTLALVSEAMAKNYGKSWLERGALKIRFKGAAYLGDRLYTRCQVTKPRSDENGQSEVCSVSVRERDSGRELVSGSATVIISGDIS